MAGLGLQLGQYAAAEEDWKAKLSQLRGQLSRLQALATAKPMCPIRHGRILHDLHRQTLGRPVDITSTVRPMRSRLCPASCLAHF